MDTVVGGDDADVPLLDRPAPRAMGDRTDRRRQIAQFARGMLEQLERIRPVEEILRSAAAVDPDVAALRDDLHLHQRRQAVTAVAGWIAARGGLRTASRSRRQPPSCGPSPSPEVHRMLRVDWRWSPERYECWLGSTPERSLLP